MKQYLFPVGLATLLIAGCASHPAFEEPEHAAVQPNSRESRTPYRLPLLSIGTKFSGLPPSVQNTIRAQVGALSMADIIKDTGSGTTVYKIYFSNEELFPPLYIAPDGSVLNPDLTVAVTAPEENIGIPSHGIVQGLKTDDLPPPVMKTIQQRAPSAEIAHIAKETWGDREVYIVSFKDPAHNPKLYVATDGSLMGGTHRR